MSALYSPLLSAAAKPRNSGSLAHGRCVEGQRHSQADEENAAWNVEGWLYWWICVTLQWQYYGQRIQPDEAYPAGMAQ